MKMSALINWAETVGLSVTEVQPIRAGLTGYRHNIVEYSVQRDVQRAAGRSAVIAVILQTARAQSGKREGSSKGRLLGLGESGHGGQKVLLV
jgi:hypothetical protein